MTSDSVYSLACTRCKRQKVKCDRTLPRCHNCDKASHECLYPAAAHRPGPKPGTSRRRPRSPDSAHNSAGSGFNSSAPVNKQQRIYNASISPSSPFDHGDEPTTYDVPMDHLLHPDRSHQPKAHQPNHSPPSPRVRDGSDVLTQTLDLMGIDWHECEKLFELYFDNITNLSLFHKPSFKQKLCSMSSMTHLEALLTAIFAFARRFVGEPTPPYCNAHSVAALLERACDLNEKSIKECGDDVAPLHVLQSLVIVTHLKLAQGVQSIAWRMTGSCARLAHDLELHLEDVESDASYLFYKENEPRAQGLIDREERRRAWWAVWEADIFASNLRRLPTSLDWHMNKTNLPSSDEDWFANRAPRSCHLAPDPVQRWRSLANCQVKSPKAWTLLMYAYKHDAFLLSSCPAQVSMLYGFSERVVYPAEDAERGGKAREMRDLVENCVRCALMAMPSELVVDDKYLSFGTAAEHDSRPLKTLDCARHTIHLMGQLITFMLYRRDVYRDAHEKQTSKGLDLTSSKNNDRHKTGTQPSVNAHAAWERYLSAAAAVSSMIRNCSPIHYKYVNPWLANAMWYAAAAQVVTGLFGPSFVNRQLTASNFDLLKSNLARFVEFWGVPVTLIQNLDTLGMRVERLVAERKPALDPSSGTLTAEKDEAIIATQMSHLTAPAAGPTAAALAQASPASMTRATSATDELHTDSEPAFQPDVFQSMLTDAFVDDMLKSTTWDNVDFSLDNIFLDPFDLQD